MDEETERRIDQAAQEAKRAKETAEFLQSLKPGDEMLRRIINPEAWHMRDKAQAAAKRGEYPTRGQTCLHPFNQLEQFVDEDPSTQRRGRAVNLFSCRACSTLLWLVDPWGSMKSDD